VIAESFYAETGGQMDKVAEAFSNELSGFRTGRASSKMLEDLEVEVYGSKMRLKELASITVPEANMILVQPWDKSAAQAIEKAIRISDLKVSPVSESGVIRVPIPPLSEERRKELGKIISKKAEESRVSIRGIRHERLGQIQEMRKKGTATEDDERRAKERIQKQTDQAIKKVDELMNKKIEELQKV